jgi:hypothetical protein
MVVGFTATWAISAYHHYGVYRHFQKYFSYIEEVSFVGGGNRSALRKPPTSRKSVANFIT